VRLLVVRRSFTAIVAAVAFLATALVPATAHAAPAEVTVMTRNLYVGFDIAPVIAAAQTDPAAVPAVAGRALANVAHNDFPVRAQAIVAEIEATRPDVIGIQEVAQFFTGPFNVPAPATTPFLDYLDILQSALAARGLEYEVAVPPRVESDQELPAALSATDLRDVRLVVSNVVLARTDRPDLTVANARSGDFTNRLTVLGQPLRRNWQTVDVTAGGRTFRFLNTHLEAGAANDAVRTLQARELAAGPLRATIPVVAVGDFNSHPGSATGAAYAVLTSPSEGKLRDAWTATHGTDPGLTCCRAELLSVAGDPLDQRLDLVLAVPQVRPRSATIVGLGQVGGLYPSDHAGVVASLRVP
jgi:endonuclease/exonuclease/phosphatase family metal-dependent hydrolase